MTDKKEGIKRTGEMMLQGWKLLATCCPICHSALLSKAEQMMCAGCNLPVMMESKANVVNTLPQTISSNTVDDMHDQESSGMSYDQMRADYDRKNARRTSVSNMIGQKLLAGWIMTEYSCPDDDNCFGTPLMRQRNSDPFFCLSCEQIFELSTTGDLVRKFDPKGSESKGNEKASGVSASKEVNAPRAVAVSDKDSSWKISQKLLHGWALLDKVCELSNCPGNVPLLKDRSGKLYCVECGYIDQVALELSTAPRPKDAISHDKCDLGEDIDDDDELDDIEAELLLSQMATRAFQSTKTSSVHELPLPVKNTSVAPSSGVKSFCLSVLNKKLLEAANNLNDSDNLQNSMNISDAITKFAVAMNAVQSLK